MKLKTRMLISKFRERATALSPARKYAGGAGVIRKGLAKEMKLFKARHGRSALANSIRLNGPAPTQTSDHYRNPAPRKR